MKSLHKVAMAILLIGVAMPAEGMWRWVEAIEQKLSFPQDLSPDTKLLIALGIKVKFIEKIIFPRLINLSGIIQNSSDPEFARTLLQIYGVAVPLAFLGSLRNNPDFWNRTGFENRLFLFICTMASMNALFTLLI